MLVVSRIDPVTKREYVAAFNNGPTGVEGERADVDRGLVDDVAPRRDPAIDVHVVGQARRDRRAVVTATLLEADGPVLSAPLPKPKLSVAPDDLSSLFAATATVADPAPVSVAFAWRTDSGSWHRIDVDTSPPYRGFIDPAKFRQARAHPGGRDRALARRQDGRLGGRPVHRSLIYAGLTSVVRSAYVPGRELDT